MNNKNEAPLNALNSERATIEIHNKDNSNNNLLEQVLEPITKHMNENKPGYISLFKKFSIIIDNYFLEDIIDDIKNGKYKNKIEKIRQLFKENNPTEVDKLKKQLPGFTVSGTFNNGRKAKELTTYSGLIVLDIDKLTFEELKNAKETAVSIPYTHSAFISPSGSGLKIIIKSNYGKEQHASVLAQATNYYSNMLKVPIDTSGKDVSRLCFVSYDPECYFNPQAENFSIQNPLVDHKKTSNQIHNCLLKVESTDKLFQECIDFTNKKMIYAAGNRNNYIHLLACNCNRKGIAEIEALTMIRKKFNLGEPELTKTVEGAYKNNSQEFAKFAKFANFQRNDIIPKEIKMMNLPYLPDEIFNCLPTILKDGSKVFSDKRERDVFLTGAIGILSGCMPNVTGSYNGKTVFANLYVFIIAPPATGKGAMQFSKELGMDYHNKLLKESAEQQRVYEIQLDMYKKSQFNKKDYDEKMEIPKKPSFKILYIPANNSSARVIQHLMECEEQGVFCETEADTMGNALKQDWGSYSDLLRKAFHHEGYTYSRKTNNEFIELNRPRLSVALAGTPGQVEGLIKSAEDGLFSRFVFYSFRSEPEWRNAGEEMNGFNLTEHFETLSKQVTNFVEFLNTKLKIKFNLTQIQWDKLNDFGRMCIAELTTQISEDMSSTAKRFGLILYRIAMIISALSYYDSGQIPTDMTCSDDDFGIALKLVNIYKEHSAFMYGELPKSTPVTDQILSKFYNLLPNEFQRKEAVEIAKTINIKERTADSYLSKLLTSKMLELLKLGVYKKV